MIAKTEYNPFLKLEIHKNNQKIFYKITLKPNSIEKKPMKNKSSI